MRVSSIMVPVAALLAAPGGLTAQEAPFAATRLARIGCDACGDARELARVYDLAVDAEGTVLVAGPDEPMLRIFSRDGSPVRQMGRPGSGPGEFRFPMRAAFGPGGTIHVLDMTLRRVSRLGRDGAETQSVPIGAFPGAVASRGETGELIVLTDDFRGALTLMRFAPGATAPVVLATMQRPPATDGHLSFPVVAASPDGAVALGHVGEAYRISRIGPNGQPLGEIVRDIPRVRRTPEELEELTRRRESARGRVQAELGRGGRGARPLPGSPDDVLKPHFGIDGLRYDPRGRLWVLTMRGRAGEAVFDVFAPAGAYLGALRVPSDVRGFALGGSYLVTSGETGDGTPIVELWAVTAK